MLSPENWQEYQWMSDSLATTSQLLFLDWRLWRVSLDVAAIADGGADTTLRFGNSAYNIPEWDIVVLAGQRVVLEPFGMYPALVTVLSGAGFNLVAERIQRIPASF